MEHDSSEVGEAVSETGSTIINVTLAAIAGDHLVHAFVSSDVLPSEPPSQ